MYHSEERISVQNLKQLRSDLQVFLERKKKIYCKALKRPVYLSKLPEVITGRKKDRKRRLQSFNVAVDILRNEKNYTKSEIDGCTRFEICGCDADGRTVKVHLREERIQNDKRLFFVSCFSK
jgi:hypothetical protein